MSGLRIGGEGVIAGCFAGMGCLGKVSRAVNQRSLTATRQSAFPMLINALGQVTRVVTVACATDSNGVSIRPLSLWRRAFREFRAPVCANSAAW